jgi:predicted CopG family antitoxin
LKIDLYFENNGVTSSVENRNPFLNAIPSELVSKTIITARAEPAEVYFGMFGGKFRAVFTANDKIPVNKKFYYPIIFSLSCLSDHVDSLIIPPEILKLVRDGMCKILIVCPYEGWVWDTYNRLIDPLVNRYNLTHDHFVIMTAKLNDHPKCKVAYYNNWEVTATGRNHSKDLELGKIAVFDTVDRPYKFICLNRRATWHRFGVVAKLWPYKRQGLLSFWQEGFVQNDYNYLTEQKKEFIKKLPNLVNLWRDNNIDKSMPLTLLKKYDPFTITNDVNPTDDQYSDKFYKSYLHIVTETSMIDEGFFSEKIFKPAIYFQPFVLVGQYKGLEYLKKIGYKTFSDVIDESYDLERDNEKRLIMGMDSAIEFIKKVDSNLMIKLWPILEHNSKVFSNRANTITNNLVEDLQKALQ